VTSILALGRFSVNLLFCQLAISVSQQNTFSAWEVSLRCQQFEFEMFWEVSDLSWECDQCLDRWNAVSRMTVKIFPKTSDNIASWLNELALILHVPSVLFGNKWSSGAPVIYLPLGDTFPHLVKLKTTHSLFFWRCPDSCWLVIWQNLDRDNFFNLPS
jgi:hypothetical protein